MVDIVKKLQDVQKGFEHAWSELNIRKDLLSLDPFNDVYKTLITLGIYTAAAVVIPFVVDFFVMPLIAVLSACALLTAGVALYHYMFDLERENQETINNYLISAAVTGGAALMLHFSGFIITAAIASAALIRLGKTLMGYQVPASVSGASLQTTLNSISENAFSAYKFVSGFYI